MRGKCLRWVCIAGGQPADDPVQQRHYAGVWGAGQGGRNLRLHPGACNCWRLLRQVFHDHRRRDRDPPVHRLELHQEPLRPRLLHFLWSLLPKGKGKL